MSNKKVNKWCYCKHNKAWGVMVKKDGYEWFKCDCGMLIRFARIEDQPLDVQIAIEQLTRVNNAKTQ